jgi:hypothetical protein
MSSIVSELPAGIAEITSVYPAGGQTLDNYAIPG